MDSIFLRQPIQLLKKNRGGEKREYRLYSPALMPEKQGRVRYVVYFFSLFYICDVRKLNPVLTCKTDSCQNRQTSDN